MGLLSRLPMSPDGRDIESRLQPAAVVCADVERYASLADKHEWLLKFDHLMGNLGQAIRTDLRASLGEESAKRYVVKPAGDGVLLVYPGDIQRALEHAWRIHNHFNTRAGRERQPARRLGPRAAAALRQPEAEVRRLPRRPPATAANPVTSGRDPLVIAGEALRGNVHVPAERVHRAGEGAERKDQSENSLYECHLNFLLG